MKNISICNNNDLKIGDFVHGIESGRVCDTYPLTDFKNYKNQIRDNEISKGVIIDITPKHVAFPTILVEYDDKVIAYRIYI